MQSLRWAAFAVSNTLSKSVVHFLPSSDTTNAPYPVTYSLNLSGREIGSRSIMLDDGRLGQPDGVRLEDLFPVLHEAPGGLMAMTIEMSLSQPKVNLSGSSCALEIITAANSVRFYAAKLSADAEQPRGMLAINDAFTLSSVLVVNCGTEPAKLDLVTPERGDPAEVKRFSLPAIDPGSAYEHSFSETTIQDGELQECSWGLFRSMPLTFSDKLPVDVAAFSVYRDVVTKRIISVKAL